MKSVVTDGNHRGAPDPAVRVSKLGFVAFGTEDLDRMVDYYTGALELGLVERTGEAAYLTTGSEHHCVVVEAGATAARTRVGLQIRGELDEAAKRLAAAGVAAERRSDPEPGIAEALVIEEPGGTPLHLYASQEPHTLERTSSRLRPSKLGHVASYVSSVPEIQRFYEEVLGFRWSDTVGDDVFVFLRCSPDHHTVNFISRDGRTGMHHIAFEARDILHVKDALDHLARCGHELMWGPGRHGAGHNIFTYHRDPDGNVVEIFTDLDVIYDEESGHYEPRPWHETDPMGPRVWGREHKPSNMWGLLPPPTARF